MTNPETQYSRKEGSQYSKEKKNNTRDTLKAEEGNTDDFFPISFLPSLQRVLKMPRF